jgi:hypothetical protein
VRDVLDLDVARRRIQQIEPPPGQHALPGSLRPTRLGATVASLGHARLRSPGILSLRCRAAHGSWRWQSTR